ncbi:MAG: hypothetical protein J6M35_03730 [Clostridia bacterium]|nr:hypothetical protein [Clostridia bacterium]
MKDIQMALNNWRRMITIQPDADLNDPAVKKNIANIERNAENALSIFKRDNPDSLFLDSKPETSNHMTREFSYIMQIAKAWGSYGTKYYHDENILETVIYCLEYMNANRYGQKEIDGTGWRNMRLFNWHDWEIGTPEHIINTLVMLGDKVSIEDRSRYLKVFDFRVPLPRDYASNKIHYEKLVIGSALLQHNEEKIYAAVKECESTNIYVDGWKNDGQGFYTDGSYIFHTRHPMNATYGIAHLRASTAVCLVFKGTKFADPVLEGKLYDWSVNSFVPFLSKTLVTRAVLGRHPSGTRGGIGIVAAVAEVASIADGERRNDLLRHVKRNLLANPEMKKEEVITNFYAGLSPDAAKLVKNVMNDDSFEVGEYNLNKVFYNEERVMHHNSGVAYALAVSSSRIYNYECINHENMDGWYLGDGMLSAYADDFYEYSDGWYETNPYRRAGTTVDDREREVITISQQNEYLSSQDFVGGISDGVSGAAAMRLESYHGDGEHISKRYFSPDGAYGGPPAKRDCTLLARKAWFFNGKNALCLGADISAHDDANVLTVIDSRKAGKDLKTLDGKIINITDKDELLPAGTKGLYFEGFGGYCFPKAMNITVSLGGKENGYVEIVAQHGKNPENGEYAYAILPTLTLEETNAFVSTPDFEILANNKDVQAVSYNNGKKMYIFWSAVSFDDIEVSAPMMVMLSENKLYACDPTRKLTSAFVKLDGKEYTSDFTDKYGATLSCEL